MRRSLVSIGALALVACGGYYRSPAIRSAPHYQAPAVNAAGIGATAGESQSGADACAPLRLTTPNTMQRHPVGNSAPDRVALTAAQAICGVVRTLDLAGAW